MPQHEFPHLSYWSPVLLSETNIKVDSLFSENIKINNTSELHENCLYSHEFYNTSGKGYVNVLLENFPLARLFVLSSVDQMLLS
jgi:hypothetical protein